MKLLAFDTSSSACTVALLNDQAIQSLHEIAPMQHARRILPMIDDLLVSAGLTLQELDAIAYGCGPGSFTGIRIAVSVAQGLGFAKELPLVPVSSLATLAQTAFEEEGWQKLVVAVDARVEHVYSAIYQANSHGIVELDGEEQIVTPEEIKIAQNKLAARWYGIGDGWAKYKERLIKSLNSEPDEIDFTKLPNAQAMLKLAKVKFQKGEYLTPTSAIPVYLR